MSRFDYDWVKPFKEDDGLRKCENCPKGCCWEECSLDNVYEKVTEKAPESVKPVYRAICDSLKQGRNIFLTAAAGAGKSYLLNAIRDEVPTLTVTASTGVAALNVGGATLHSTLCIGIANRTPEQQVTKLRPYNAQFLQDLKFLAIDEVSMISGELLDYCNRFLKLVRQNNEPFGGVQVILIGDFCQLPPVNTKGYYDFCFFSDTWRELNLETFYLTHNFRQEDDPAYADFLKNLRAGILTSEGHELLKSRTVEEIPEEIPILFATNKEVFDLNVKKLAELPSKKYIFRARFESPTLEKYPDVFKTVKDNFIKSTIMEEELVLCEGARIMLLKNMDINQGLVNGTLGYIKQVSYDEIVIVTDDEIETKVPLHKVQTHDKEGKVLMEMTQYPLKLAYAITTHKSQGATLEKVFIDFNKFFEVNQAYVALSRVKKSQGLFLKNYNPCVFSFAQAVLEFYKSIEK